MEGGGGGGDDPSCLPADFWMSQVSEPHQHYVSAAHLGSAPPATLGDARTSSLLVPTPDNPTRKQPSLYDSYGNPAVHYKQSIVGRVPTVVQQPFTSASSRSAWEFAAENLRSSPKDLTSQSYSLYTTSAAAKFSQSPNDFVPENLSSQSRGTATAHSFSQPLSNYTHSSKPKSMENILSQSASQAVRDMPTTHNVSQSSSSDRSVWAHLYSLDPSISSFGVNPPMNPITSYSHGKSQSLPYSHDHAQQGRDAFHPLPSPVSGGILQPQKPPLISSRDLMASPYFNTSSLPPESVSTTSFASSGYSSEVINVSKQPSQATAYEERLEEYSPVSPPTRDPTPPFSSATSAQNGDLVPKSDGFPGSSDFSYNTSSTSSSGQAAHSDPGFLPMSLDVPLDMSKGWAMPEPEIETPAVSASNEPSLSLPIRSDISPVEFSKQTNQSSDLPVINQFGNNSQKAPKKSNFYGRDASIFSLPDNSVESNNLPLSGKVNTDSSTPDSRPDVKLNVPVPPVTTDYDVPQVGGSVSQTQNLAMPTNDTFEAGFDSIEPNFADSFIDASTTPCSYDNSNLHSVPNKLAHPTDQGNDGSVSDFDDDMDYSDTDVLQSQVKAVREKKHGAVATKDLPSLSQISDQVDDSSEQHLANPPTEAPQAPEMDPSVFPLPGLVKNVRGKGTRGRGKRATRVTRGRGRGRGKNQTQALVGGLAQTEMFVGPSTGDDGVASHQATGSVVFSVPPPKPKPARGRKRKAAGAGNPDDDASSTRRSSNRRSKDNAMRLIELQAESVYNHPAAKPVAEEPKPPARGKRKAAKAAMKNSFDESKFEEEFVTQIKDSSSDEMSDEKDADYAVDDDDVAALEKDELLDISLNQKKPAVAEKRAGGLKISIKLGSDSSAEIVSGIDQSPPRKKRKTLKKKVAKSKFKSKAIIQDEEEEDGDKVEEKVIPQTSTNESEADKKTGEGDLPTKPEEKPDIVNKHNSLMDKYFSSAGTATLSHQPQKSAAVKKEKKLKSNSAIKSKALKNVKNTSSKDSSVKASSLTKESNSTPDKGMPKFRCGYCSNRYHDKHTLLSHMEAHMAEMEDKEDKKSGGSTSKEPKKPVTPTPTKKLDSVPKKHSVPQQAVKKSEGPEEQEYNCGECGKNFPSKSKLLDHVRTHTAEKPFECNLCHKCFKERNQLSAHRKVHIQEGLIRCPICSKGFVNNSDLTAHMESHPKRSKSGGPSLSHSPNKILVPEPAKKIGKLQHVSSDKESVPTKPKSFASALEPHSGKSKDQSTLVLKRNDSGVSVSKDEATNSKSINKSTKPVTNVPKTTVKDDLMKKQPQISDKASESKEIKSDHKVKSVNETVPKPEVKKEEEDKNTSGQCTCKECPECVTRFLQSFV